MDSISELASAFARFPGIGPRQAKRFVYHLLNVPPGERDKLAVLITKLHGEIGQCTLCKRFSGAKTPLCAYCGDERRDNAFLMVVEKDQDLEALERSGTYKGRYFVLGGALTLSGKGSIREESLLKAIDHYKDKGLSEIILALSATAEGEHTTDHLRRVLAPLTPHMKLTTLGRGLSTGSELEYSDKETLQAAFQNRKET